MRLEGKIALVTGAASGFGAVIAERFVEEGAKVVIADIQDDQGKALANRLGENALFVSMDVTDFVGVSNAFKLCLAEFGDLHIVVNNAGITHRNQPMLDVDEEEYDHVFDVNVKAHYIMARTVVPHFRKQKNGCILNVASTAGVRPRPGLVWYNTTKAAVIGMTKSMAVELAADGIRVNAINPVAGETPLLEKFMGEDTPEKREAFRSSVPLGRFSKPEDIANAAVYLVSDEAEFITGVDFLVDGGRCI